jgi:hypothetical protein
LETKGPYFFRVFRESAIWPKRIRAKAIETIAMETMNIGAAVFTKFSTPDEVGVNLKQWISTGLELKKVENKSPRGPSSLTSGQILPIRFQLGFLPFFTLLGQENLTCGFQVAPVIVAVMDEDFLPRMNGTGGHDEYAFFAFAGLDFVVGVVGQSFHPAYSSGVVGIAPLCPGCEKGIDATVLGDENGVAFMALVRSLFAFRPGDDFSLVFANDITPTKGLFGEQALTGFWNLAGFDKNGIRPVRSGTFCNRMFFHGRPKIGALNELKQSGRLNRCHYSRFGIPCFYFKDLLPNDDHDSGHNDEYGYGFHGAPSLCFI